MTDRPTTFEELGASLGIRRVTLVHEEVYGEAGSVLDTPVHKAAAIAVVKNPWIIDGTTTGTDADLDPATRKIAPVIAKLLADRLLAALGGAGNIEAFGKAALVGTDGELEHAGALIHTPYFGNLIREMLEGTSIICFTDGRVEPGTDVHVPMWHKTHAANRDHYQTIDVPLADAPHADEICVIAAASTGPRPFPRIGDRTTDIPVTTDILKGLLP
ncbi:MAG: amino acid synthesis family protein [Corynebacterium provencense]|jgi:hypothetical protein|uniref:amino acid synthesis family protein n=1 Tax=Corynebacterium provencense TaxID=1737425 RepID=UPI002989C36D|nr:amino acid synthesis family protein [Corynebacterium provencense]